MKGKPAMLENARVLVVPTLLVLWSGCDAQVSPEYQGQALLTISGSVEVDSARERGRLRPALAFFNDRTSEFRIMDVDVEGEFPSDFTLRVFEPPPPEAIVEAPDRPASAVAYITAVTEDHPETVRYALGGGGIAGCVFGPDDELEPRRCEFQEQWCTSDGSECYREHRICPDFDSPLEDCEIVSSSGDHRLREDPWANFAGIADFYRIVYLQEALAADDPIAVAADLPGLAAGYHLIETRPLSEAERQAQEECAQRADALTVERYNDAHGTDYPPIPLPGPVSCGSTAVAAPAPGGDQPDPQAPSPETEGDAEPEPEPEPAQPATDSLDCAELPPEDVLAELEELSLATRIELGCSPTGVSLRVIENHEEERISVRVAADVQPF